MRSSCVVLPQPGTRPEQSGQTHGVPAPPDRFVRKTLDAAGGRLIKIISKIESVGLRAFTAHCTGPDCLNPFCSAYLLYYTVYYIVYISTYITSSAWTLARMCA